MGAGDCPGDHAEAVPVLALPAELSVIGDGDDVELTLPRSREAGPGRRAIAPRGKFAQFAVGGFGDAAERLGLQRVGEREAEQARADPWRRRLDALHPGKAQLFKRHRL